MCIIISFFIGIYFISSTFVCPTEIIAFSDRADEFRAINCEVLACSVDSEFSHLAWCVWFYFVQFKFIFVLNNFSFICESI